MVVKLPWRVICASGKEARSVRKLALFPMLLLAQCCWGAAQHRKEFFREADTLKGLTRRPP